MRTRTRNWLYFATSAGLLAICSAYVYLAFPQLRGLLSLALYTIPSHMFVSPFSHEPVLLYFAKSYDATSCALASLAGCLVAGMWDYWLFVPLMHNPRVRSKYANVSLYRKSVGLFRKSPFWALVVAGLTPLPFYPVKFLSISDHYPLKRYLLALTVGRTPRYWLLAYMGYVLRLPNWSLVALALLILVFTLVQSRRERRNSRTPDGAAGAAEVCPTTTRTEASAKSISSGR